MRTFTSRSAAFFSALALATLAVAACTRDLPTGSTISESTVHERRTSVSYTSTLLPLLAGDNTSRANGVNDAGEVVGYSCCSQQNRAFVTLGGVGTELPGSSAVALAISNGATRYVVGRAGAPSLPVQWSISGSTPSQPAYLNLGTATGGSAIGVNDLGEAVGHAGADAAMWDAAGNLALVETPTGYTRGEGRDINNAGDAVFVFSRSGPAWSGSAIGYLRLADGSLIPLPPLTSGGISYANSVSAASNGQLMIAGSSYEDQANSRAVQWTVTIASRQIAGTAVRTEDSHSVAISDAGTAAGFTDPTNSTKTTAFRWQGTELLPLNPPRGGKEGKAWAISPDGIFVAGEAMVQLSRRAILWTMPAQ